MAEEPKSYVKKTVEKFKRRQKNWKKILKDREMRVGKGHV